MIGITPLLTKLEQAVTTEQILAALTDLGSSKNLEALPHLIKAFGYNRPAVGDAAFTEVLKFGEAAVPTLLSSIDEYDYGARAYSIRALSQIQDARAFDLLLKSIRDDFAPSVRRAATKGIGMIAAQRSNSEQQDTVQLLQMCLKDHDWGIRYAAVYALQSLQVHGCEAIQTEIQRALAGATQDPDPLVQRKTQASSRTGY